MPARKRQIFVRGLPDPYWFSSVRDAFAFTMLQETPKAIAAIYVNDMARAKNWDQPEPGTWVEAHQAYFRDRQPPPRRHGRRRSDPVRLAAAAQDFADANGGRVVSFAEMPRDYVLARRLGKSAMQITRRRFIAITAAAGGLPLLPIASARADAAAARMVRNRARLRRDFADPSPGPGDRRSTDRREPRGGGASRTDHEPLSARQRAFAPQPRRDARRSALRSRARALRKSPLQRAERRRLRRDGAAAVGSLRQPFLAARRLARRPVGRRPSPRPSRGSATTRSKSIRRDCVSLGRAWASL